jgi:AraC family transcriptional regulator of arabinose operon
MAGVNLPMDRAIKGLYNSMMSVRPIRVDSDTLNRPRTPVRVASPGYFECGPTYRVRRGGQADLLIIVTQQGAGLLQSKGVSLTLQPGEAAVWLPQSDQDYGTCPEARRWSFRWAHAMPRAEWWASLDWPTPLPGVAKVRLVDPQARQGASSALRHAVELASSSLPGAERLVENAVEETLLWCATQATAQGRLDARVRAASDVVRRNLHRRISVEEMAEAAGVSEPRLTTLFRQSLGTSPAKHAEDVRLQHAAHLLRSGNLSAKEVAHACGFHDPPHFSRRYRQKYGRSPTEAETS